MLASALFSRHLAIAGLPYLVLLCIISLGESLEFLPSAGLTRQFGQVEPIIKRTWESEQGPFSNGPPDDYVEGNEAAEAHTLTNDSPERIGVPGLGKPLPPITSIVASVLGASADAGLVPGLPTPPVIPEPVIPVPIGASGGLFSSVISILAGAPSAVPTSPGGNDEPLGGLLSVLSQVSPVPVSLSITGVPVVPTQSGGLLPAFNVLDGVAAALDDVLGSSKDSDSQGSGLLGQLSANIIDPIASIAADPTSIIAHPTAALIDLQSQVSSLLDGLPSAVAAGVQLASNVGGQIAGALDATTEVLDSVPAVANGVAEQVGSLLNAAPNLATGLPAAALSVVNQVESVLAPIPDLGSDVAGILRGMREELSSAAANALPEVTSLAAIVGSQVVSNLPPVLQGPVQGVVSDLQNDITFSYFATTSRLRFVIFGLVIDDCRNCCRLWCRPSCEFCFVRSLVIVQSNIGSFPDGCTDIFDSTYAFNSQRSEFSYSDQHQPAPRAIRLRGRNWPCGFRWFHGSESSQHNFGRTEYGA
ncbi:hypothetical protein J7T55_008140 [Diaporthe amygdali]|uniref:uncharacterized protein n=1 Tax=Phomopsis amygdali TaxID=1214568 RepID=UPI0022FEC6E3|nr:uncharacterized protein J7T55_008140 [Diaporthe amygdali]KAJ0108004.1 hypothetical protein J7T55_008140 [Diaporthe amygdali]